MSCPPQLVKEAFYYPFGGTRAVCLTQDLPPNVDADILLLGCGDVRNILFTCFVDHARKMDITCCDNEPFVLARNVLLYSLIIDDTANLNVEKMWNIYYHWKLDKDSTELLETQTSKLLSVSNSIDEWHDSVYGSSIRFYDAKSLSSVRSHWMCFQLRGLSFTEKEDRFGQLHALAEKTKKFLKNMTKDDGIAISFDGLEAASPVGIDSVQDVSEILHHWYIKGTVPQSSKPINPNPAFLYSGNRALSPLSDLNPLLGFPLGIAFAPITKGSIFYLASKNIPSTNYLVKCTKNIFAQWVAAFKIAVANQLVVRIFSGDALNLCVSLRNRQCKQGNNENVESDAPSSFDIIDTSTLVDLVGLLNLIAAGSCLLKHHAASSLYVEMLKLYDPSPVKRLFEMFGVDPCSISLLFGLVSPDLFTNSTNSFEKDPVIDEVSSISACAAQEGIGRNTGSDRSHSRLRWKRSPGYQEASLHVDAKALAILLYRVHNLMFKCEDLPLIQNLLRDVEIYRGEIMKLQIPRYSRAGFAFLVSCLGKTVVTDWNQCVQYIFNIIAAKFSPRTLSSSYFPDLVMNLHNYGLDNGRTVEHSPAEMSVGAVLLPYLPPIPVKELPSQLCVTVRVARQKLNFFTSQKIDPLVAPVLVLCILGEFGGIFTNYRLAFGTWHGENKLHPYIEEDELQLSGTSDMFVSAMVPTTLLLLSKKSVPKVSVGFKQTPYSYTQFRKNLPDQTLQFTVSEMTSKDVFITQYMPGMSKLPEYPLTSTDQSNSTSAATTIQITSDGLKIDTLTRRIILESQEAKNELADKSSNVEVKFKSPFTALIRIGQSLELKCEFPAPVSVSNYKLRIAKKSSYIELEAQLFNPLGEDASSFIFPTFIMETPHGITVPISWASSYINLDVMPIVNLENTHAVLWIVGHVASMFSKREQQIHQSKMTNRPFSGAQVDTRTNLKEGIFAIFMHYTGLRGLQADCFGLTINGTDIKTLIFPSCLRLDSVNCTVVLDAAMIPITPAILEDSKAVQFLSELTDHGLCQVKVTEDENLAWRAMMPALVERCRTASTWEHTPNCEYVKAGEAPLGPENSSPICSCGIGKFPSEDYLQSQIGRCPDLAYMISQYGARAAIAPIFAVQEVEDCTLLDFSKIGRPKFDDKSSIPQIYSSIVKSYFKGLKVYNKEKCIVKEKCAKCGKSERINVDSKKEALLCCAKCFNLKYCSKECQIADWQKHKLLCSASR